MLVFQILLECFSIEMWTFGPSIKFLSPFDFLSRRSAYVFITNCCLNGHWYISLIVLNISSKVTHNSQNVYGHLTLNEMYINLFD